MTSAAWAWAAGLFEGEGSITLTGKTGVSARLSMTDEDVVRRFDAVVGVGAVTGPYPGTNKPRWTWQVCRRDHVRLALEGMRPWLGERRCARVDEALPRTVAPLTRTLRPIEHGTIRGYQAEYRRGLLTCDACRAANAETSRIKRHSSHPSAASKASQVH